MIKNQAVNIFLIILIFSGIFLRFYNLRFNTMFNWDQENLLAFPAKSILIDHKFTLIGAPTGVGDLRIGPLYSYLAAAAFYFTGMDPIAGPILSGTLAIFTAVIAVFLIKYIVSINTALHFAALWLLSPFILTFDRTPWNVNLLPLASILVCLGLWMVYLDLQKYGWSVAGLGIFIGANSHFSSIFLVVVSIIVALDTRKKISRYFLFLPLFFVIAIAPLAIFNLRHDNILINNFSTFTYSSLISSGELFNTFLRSLSLNLETLGRLILPNSQSLYQILLASIMLGAIFILNTEKKYKAYKRIMLFFLISYIIGFSLYKRHIPDYYILGLIPPFTLGLAQLLYKYF